MTAGFGMGTLLLATGFFLLDPLSLRESEENDLVQDLPAVEITKPVIMYGMVIDDLEVTQDLVKRNQRFSDLLQGYFVPAKIQQQLSLLPRQTFDFRKIGANKKYTLLLERDSLRSVRALVYEANLIDYYIFHLKDSMRVEAVHREVITLEKEVAGVIGASLSQTIEAMGISHELTNRFVDIFAWQVDFQHLQKGDRFKLFYEEQQVEGLPVGIGRILGIYFDHFNHPYYGVPFDQGAGLNYFDEEGKSLKKALLKFPLEFTRISSRYTMARFHPVQKTYHAHLGTDFAAPAGTPIRTVGDGVVLEAQYKGNNGNYVKIRHNSVYTTQYLHMSKIAPGMSPGVTVKQGETIGYVGSTGLSTGPHVHYSFWQHGVQVDALKVQLPPSEPIRKEFEVEFEAAKLRVIKRLDLISLPEPPIIMAKN